MTSCNTIAQDQPATRLKVSLMIGSTHWVVWPQIVYHAISYTPEDFWNIRGVGAHAQLESVCLRCVHKC